jgi:hypothetical protein
MIQRPQSLVLFLTAVLYGLMAFAPLWQLTVEPSTITLNASNAIIYNLLDSETSIIKEIPNVYLLAACACGAILSIVTIFLFNNRPLQAKISAINAMIITVFIGLTIFIAIPNYKQILMSQDNGTYQWGFFLTVPILISIFITTKLIRKDEALVKSVDRIR